MDLELLGPSGEGNQAVVVEEVVATKCDEHQRLAHALPCRVLADVRREPLLVVLEVLQMLRNPDDVHELHACVIEDVEVGGREVGADEQVLATHVGAQVRQRGFCPEVLT